LLRSGERCRSVAVEGDFCAHHAARASDVGELRAGSYPPRGRQGSKLVRVVTEPEQNERQKAFAMNSNGTLTPSDVRPHLAEVAAANLSEIERVLIETATGANRQVWITVTCKHCERQGRYEVDVPDNRTRLDAVEKLLQQGLGRAREAEESRVPRLPETEEAIEQMPWSDQTRLMNVLCAEQVAAVADDGGAALMRERVAELTEDGRQLLRDALDAVPAED
jgi:hypothetical protein